MKKTVQKRQSGFTLIELLVVVVLISALAVAVFAALNPAQRLKDARNARRTADVDTILSAMHQGIVDSKGNYPQYMPVAGSTIQLGNASSGCTTNTGTACGTGAVCVDVLTGTNNLSAYLKSVPVDPSATDASESGYSISRDANGIVTVTACMAEGVTVTASR